MQKKFLSNLILVLILNVLVKPYYILGIDAEFLKRVEETNAGEYGEYFSLVGLTFIFNIFLDFGITNYNTTSVAQKEENVLHHFSGILSLRVLLIFGYVAMLALSGLFLGYSDHQFYLLSILALNQVLVAFILFFRSNLSGLLRFTEDSIVSVLDRAILVIICTMLLWSNIFDVNISIELFIWLQTVSYLITFIIAFFLVLRQTKFKGFSFNFKYFKVILSKSLPYALLILLMMISYRVDAVMLERMLVNGKREAALYAQGFRFFEAFTMIGYLFAGLLLPIFARMLAKKEEVSQMVYLSFKIILAIGVLIGIGGYVFSYDLMNMRYEVIQSDLEKSAASFRYLMVCFVAMCTTYIFGTLLTANGSLKYLNYLAAVGVVVNLVLNYFFIQADGAEGAAKASMITQIISALAQIFLAIKILKIKVEIKEVARMAVFIGGVAALSKAFDLGNWQYNLIMFFVAGGIWMLITGMLNPKKALDILKAKE